MRPPHQPPEWHDLRAELAYAAEAAEAKNAFVWDAWGLVWGSAEDLTPQTRPVLFDQLEAIIAQLDPPLEKGGRLAGQQDVEGPVCWCHSFAATYVLMFWFEEAPDELKLRRVVNGALSRVEARTLAMPSIDPEGGPGGGVPGEKRMRLFVPRDD